MIKKSKIIRQLEKDHQYLRKIINKLTEEQITEVKIIDNWTLKDIIAHLSAWAWETIDEIDRVIKDKASWQKKYETNSQEDKFNRVAVEKRKSYAMDRILREWEESYQIIKNKVASLTDKEWLHQSINHYWTFGRLAKTPVTVFSLFDYEYEEKSLEASHTVQIKKLFNIKVD